MENQHDDGSWGSDSLLDRIVATCHSSMALMSAGFMLTDPTLSAALRFLKSDRVSVHTWCFWRVAPLLSCPGNDELLRNDLAHIADRVRRRSGSPHPDQLVELFLMKMHIALDNQDHAIYHMSPVLNDYDPASGWFGRADTTTHAVAVLAALDQPPDGLPEILTTADRILTSSCVQHGPGLVSWGSRVSTTAYTVMNLLESPLRDRPWLSQLASAGVRWVCGQQRSDGSWARETPPFGGEGEIIHPAYFTAVALRCILAHADATMADATALVQASHARARIKELTAELTTLKSAVRLAQATGRRWRTAAIVTVTSATLCAALMGGYMFRMVLLSNWTSVTGLAVVVVGAVLVLVFDLLHYSSLVARWVRSRLNP